MSQPIKLSYFNIQGLGEPIRYLLSYGDMEFIDDRFEFEEFPERKFGFPYGKVPVMEMEGKTIHQSRAICRYLAKKLGLAGSNEWEELECDMIVDTMDDFRAALATFRFESNEELKAQRREHVIGTQTPYYLNKFEQQVASNGGHFVNGKLTWADFFFCSVVDYLSFVCDTNLLENRTNLQNLKKKVDDIPKIKAYIQKRPVFNPINKF